MNIKDNLHAKSITTIIATVFAKALGFIRSAVLASMFGYSWQTDAFYMTTSILDSMSGLNSSMSAIIVPMRAQIIDEEGIENANKYINSIYLFCIVVFSLISLCFTIFSKNIVSMFAPKFDAKTFELAQMLLKCLAFSIIIYSLISVSVGLLNSEKSILPTQTLGVPLNLLWIAISVIFYPKINFYAMVLGYAIGVMAQFLYLSFFTRKFYKFSFNFYIDKNNLKKTFSLIFPIFISSNMYLINQIIDKSLASGLAEGSISGLDNANQIVNIIYAILITSIISLMYGYIAEKAAKKKYQEADVLLLQCSRIILILLVPVTAFLFVFSREFIELIFLRGSFDSTAALFTSNILRSYIFSLLGLSISVTFTRGFYVRNNSKIPLIISLIGSVISITLSLVFINHFGILSFGFATTISAFFLAATFFIIYGKMFNVDNYKRYVFNLIKIFLSGILFFVLCNIIKNQISEASFFVLALSAIILFVIYCITLIILREDDFVEILTKWKRKIK